MEATRGAPPRSSSSSFASIQLEALFPTIDRLERYEQISIAFLLLAPDEALAECVELASARRPLMSRGRLARWACAEGPAWPEALVEALCVIKAYSDVRALGFEPAKMRARFLSEVVEASVRIHPVKKALYALCEHLESEPTERFVSAFSLEGSDERDRDYLEVFLLRLVAAGRLSLGSWSPDANSSSTSSTDSSCDVAVVLGALGPGSAVPKTWLESAARRVDEEAKARVANSLAHRPVSREVHPDDLYPIPDRRRVGRLLIFNHENFDRSRVELTRRLGTDKDVLALKSSFAAFGFDVDAFEDLRHDEICPRIRSAADGTSDSEAAFAVCILSHGTRGAVYGSDGVALDVSTIKAALQSARLLGKPKILIVQACRGNEVMRPRPLADRQQSSPSASTAYESIVADNSAPAKIPEMADLLTFWSTVENYVSYRDTENGTWFIQELCANMLERGGENHLVDVFTAVNYSVSLKKFQISELVSTFRKKFQLSMVL